MAGFNSEIDSLQETIKDHEERLVTLETLGKMIYF